jgi:hypothetical protein
MSRGFTTCLLLSQRRCAKRNGIAEHRAQMRLRVSAFAEQIEGNGDSAGLEKMKPLLWFAEAKKAGFAWLIIAMELVMRREAEGGGETSIVTRR